MPIVQLLPMRLKVIDDAAQRVPHRRYFGVSSSKEFKGLNIKKDNKLNALANVHQGVSLAASQFLKSRIK